MPTRADVIDDVALVGRAATTALSEATDAWLVELLAAATDDLRGLALVAVGGYGRAELAPGSDLDLMLVHHKRSDIAKVAERLWYPIWDTKTKLGHAVRTVKEAIKLAAEDMDTATSLLTVRCLAGDSELAATLARDARDGWRKRSGAWLSELDVSTRRRHIEKDEVAFLLEPDLKEGRGGLRDVHALQWAQLAGGDVGDLSELDDAYGVLLTARVALHRVTGRAGDSLSLQEQDAVAEATGHSNADALMAAVASSARTIAWASDEAWHHLVPDPARTRIADHAVASGVRAINGEMHLDANVDISRDPTVVLRLAAAAARLDTRIAPSTLDRLNAELPVFPDPWPAGAVNELCAVFLAGRPAIDVIESLDTRNLVSRILPEWEVVRCKPQRNAFHRFTVDRHLLECIANAAALAPRVSRPDLLVLGALFHDLGKGRPGDHSEVGVELAHVICPRMGIGRSDVDVIATMVRYHLLLPEVATRRDISDDMTITSVAETVGNAMVLELLHALTEADSLATGPSAWGPWKAELVTELVNRVDHVLGGGEVSEVSWSLFPTPEVDELMGSGVTLVRGEANAMTVVAPDRPGLFSIVAGVLSLHGCDVLGAQAHSDEQGMAANQFTVATKQHVDWPRIEADLAKAMVGRLALAARVAERARTYGRRKRATAAQPMVATRVVIDNGASSNATVVEVHCPDSIGVLYRVTRALADLQLDIRHARVTTLGSEVVDSFYVRDATGSKVLDGDYLKEVERAILHAAL
jgi:[protein-PII] uridylyltransferase